MAYTLVVAARRCFDQCSEVVYDVSTYEWVEWDIPETDHLIGYMFVGE